MYPFPHRGKTQAQPPYAARLLAADSPRAMARTYAALHPQQPPELNTSDLAFSPKLSKALRGSWMASIASGNCGRRVSRELRQWSGTPQAARQSEH